MNTFEPALFQLLFIDIETVPQFPNFEQMSEKWQQLFIDKTAKTMPDTSTPNEYYSERAGILAEFGKIICISLGFFYKNEKEELCFKLKNIASHDEKFILEQFVLITDKFRRKYKKFQFAGHNIREFDVPYISRRILINQIPFPDFLPNASSKPWETTMFDSLQHWKFGDYKNYISLDLLAATLDVPTSKDDISGKDVARVYYKENDLARIAKYCSKDVVVVANVYLRMQQQPLLKDENILRDE